MKNTNPWKRSFAAGGVALTFMAGAAQSEETLTYATYLSDVFSVSKASHWLVDEIEKRSNGEIKFEKYVSGSLLTAPDLFPGLASGAADIVMGAPHAYNVSEYPLANILMPYMTTQIDAITYAWGELYRNNADFRAEYERKGVKPLFVSPYSENTIWSTRPVETVEDLAGLKVRAVPPVSIALKELGATPVALAWPEGVDGMRRGVVEGMSSAPFDSAVNAGLYEVAPYVTGAGTGALGVATIAISIDRYNSLSPELQKIIDEVSAEATAKGLQFLDQTTDVAVEKLCGLKEPVTINVFSEAEVAKANAVASAKLEEAWLERASSEANVDGVAMLAEFKGYIQKFEETSQYVSGFARYNDTCTQN
ncbi:TRAP transporter substrate-binding protein DctP [Ruegeria atlantica]|uniref:TRAP transporter substrate-binding protein DctP n=1 Tax=Ruegeria atlantica TaxID=81569 RepID=UPI0014809264|nr:TRAP transporter substrate-binding protein DctP [Ruegeria atlantica]